MYTCKEWHQCWVMPTRGGSFCDRPCPPAYILSSGIGSLGGNGLIDPPCPKGAVDMTEKQLQLHPDPQALVPFTFYYLEVQLIIITNNIELLLNARVRGGYIGIQQRYCSTFYNQAEIVDCYCCRHRPP